MPEWSEAVYVVTRDEPGLAVPQLADDPTLIIDYLSEGQERDDGQAMCPHRDDERQIVCRMWRFHPGPCIPWSRQIVATTGVYVLAVES